jgi:hypothetical protein
MSISATITSLCGGDSRKLQAAGWQQCGGS